MIQKRFWILPIVVILSIALVGCGHTEAERLETVDPAAWPTPQPAAVIPSSTPFPKIYLEDVATATPAARLEAKVSQDSELDSKDETTPLAVNSEEEASRNNRQPVAQAEVTSFALNMRQGPGIDYGLVGGLSQGDRGAVLALNPGRTWALVEFPNPGIGWVSLKHLTIDGSLDNAPIMNSTPPGLEMPSGSSAAEGDTNDSTANNHRSEQNIVEPETIQVVYASNQPAAVDTSPFDELQPVATARIGRGEVDVRPAYSATQAPIDTITADREDIAILALDPSREWALVNPAHAKVGWMTLSDLDVIEGSVANAPEVFTAWTNSNELTLRSGPGIYHDPVGTLSINNLVVMLGLNESRSWASVKPVVGQGQGWVQIKFLTLSEPVADLPLAPTPPPAPTPVPIDPAAAAISAKQGKLVFQLSSGGEIMTINADGTGLRHLTHGIDPALSPDGQTVAFTRWQGDDGSLWLINIDGSNEHSIMGFTKKPKGPAWSPDGSQLVLNFQHEGTLKEKTVCHDLTEASAPPRPPFNASGIEGGLDQNNDPVLCWKLPPDPHWSLRLVNVADGSFEDLDGGTYAFRPAWDPVQPWRIVSDGGQGLVDIDLNRDHRQHLTENVNDGSPIFSPDGRYLALTVGQPGGSQGYDIYRLNSDGGGRVRLTQTPLWIPVVPGEGKAWNHVSPAWSPDSSQIAFLTDRTGRWEIWVMNVDGSNQRPMFSETVNDQLQLRYDFVDERVMSWR